MNAIEFVKKFGLEKAKQLNEAVGCLSIAELKATYSPKDLKAMQKALVSGDLMRADELKRIVESHENLELLGGIKKGKEILDGVPVGSDGFVLWTGKVRYINSSTKCVFSDKSNEWFPANVMVLNLIISFDALKNALTDVEACQCKLPTEMADYDLYVPIGERDAK